ADVAGVPRAAIVEMSKRAREMEQVLPQMEAFYTRGNGMKARGRQMAAYITRAAKDEHGVDPAALRPWWADQLDGVGFTERSLRTGRTVSAVGAEALYTTQDMLAVEEDVFAAYERGRDAGVAVVPAHHVDAALAKRPYLGEDQVEMVRSICASGHRIQCVLGPAGSGKTTALEAAARAWEAAGHRPIGAVIQGTATEVLREAAGIECSTVASLL